MIFFKIILGYSSEEEIIALIFNFNATNSSPTIDEECANGLMIYIFFIKLVLILLIIRSAFVCIA